MIPASEFRRRARETLGGHIFQAPWLFALLAALIANAILGVAGITYVVSLILTGPIMIGLNSYFLARVRRSTPYDNLNPLFDGFRRNVGDNILVGLLINIFTMLWTLLFIIPGIVKAYSYSMAYYIKLDHPEYTATQAITESRKLMNGHKADLFLLDLSFLGWIIVGALCFGIGTLWVTPYQLAARTEFYKALVGPTVEIPELETNI